MQILKGRRDVEPLPRTAEREPRQTDFGLVIGVDHDPLFRPLPGAATDATRLTLEPPRDENAGQTALDAARSNPIISPRSRGLDGKSTLPEILDRALLANNRRPSPSGSTF